MTREDVFTAIAEVVSDRTDTAREEVKEESTFRDLGVDSLDTVEMIMDFENAFDIKIPDEEAEKITTVGEAIEHIEKAVAAK